MQATILFVIATIYKQSVCDGNKKSVSHPTLFENLEKTDYLVALMASTIRLKVFSISLSKPTEKRISPSLIPISRWRSSGTSEDVDFPELLKRVLK